MGKNNDMTTEAQLEIYFKRLKPVWKADMFKIKEAFNSLLSRSRS